MAPSRHLPSSAVLVLLALCLAALPALLLLQPLVRRARHERERLSADLLVRLNDAEPHHLALALLEAPPGRPGELALAGAGRLRGPSFPWRPAPIEGQLSLGIAAAELVGRSTPFEIGTAGGQLRATYAEHYLAGAAVRAEPGSCAGTVTISRLALDGPGAPASWSAVHRFQGALDLACAGVGPDGRSGTADDLRFALLGTLDGAWGAAP